MQVAFRAIRKLSGCVSNGHLEKGGGHEALVGDRLCVVGALWL